MLIARRRHVDDLSLDQLDACPGRQQTDLRHAVKLVDGQPVPAQQLVLHDSAHGSSRQWKDIAAEPGLLPEVSADGMRFAAARVDGICLRVDGEMR